jgi:hypothetical protein
VPVLISRHYGYYTAIKLTSIRNLKLIRKESPETAALINNYLQKEIEELLQNVEQERLTKNIPSPMSIHLQERTLSGRGPSLPAY